MNKVKINVESVPKGQMVDVPHLGSFPNGYTSNVEDFQVESWKSHYGGEYPSDGLVLPAPPDEAAKTDAQSEGELQAQIIERQNARSPEEAKKEEKDATMAILRGKPMAVVPQETKPQEPKAAKGANK